MAKQRVAAGLALHRSGRVVEAEAAYRGAVAGDPEDRTAAYLLGVCLHQTGRSGEAEPWVRRAADRPAATADQLNTLAGVVLALRRPREAVDAARRAIAADPRLPEPHCTLGNALLAVHDYRGAAAAYRDALALRPAYGRAATGFAAALGEADAPPAALVTAFARAAELSPDDPVVRCGFGTALQRAGAVAASVEQFQRAVALRPELGEAHNNLAVSLRLAGRVAESLAAVRRAIQVQPDNATANSNLANALQESGDWGAALAFHERAIGLDPSLPDSRLNFAHCLLTLGRFAEGWPLYESRWGVAALRSEARRFDVPPWDGTDPAGRTILVHAEQGFGDAVQFARYVPLIAARGGRVVFEVHPELARLLADTPGAAAVVARGDPLPPFDLHVPLMSVPLLTDTTVETIPAAPATLRADAAAVARWRARLDAVAPGVRRVGLAWAGRSTHGNDRNRSLRPADLAPLADVPGVRFVSLQVTRPTAGGPPLPLLDWTDELADFADTAALAAALDAVVSADTAVAHVAASLGVPTHLLLPFTPDFRWLLGRADSPWYASVRLHRQAVPGVWADPVRSVAAVLGKPGLPAEPLTYFSRTG